MRAITRAMDVIKDQFIKGHNGRLQLDQLVRGPGGEASGVGEVGVEPVGQRAGR
jgi:hypothetical protein